MCLGIDVPHLPTGANINKHLFVKYPRPPSMRILTILSHSYRYFYIDKFLSINLYRYFFIDKFISIYSYRFITGANLIYPYIPKGKSHLPPLFYPVIRPYQTITQPQNNPKTDPRPPSQPVLYTLCIFCMFIH